MRYVWLSVCKETEKGITQHYHRCTFFGSDPTGYSVKSETSYETMLDIMEYLHQYVPAMEIVGTFINSTDGHTKQCKAEKVRCILLGGDQLTVSRAKGCQRIRSDSITPRERLEGLQPVIEDWHAKGVFLELGTMITHVHISSDYLTSHIIVRVEETLISSFCK